MSQPAWNPLGAVAPTALSEARLVAHHAAQLAAAAGSTWLRHQDDWSHENLGWDAAARALASREVGGAQAALRIADLALLVLGARGVEAALPLVGHTRAEGERWLAAQLGPRVSGSPKVALPPHEIPDHPVARGEPFPAVDREALAEVARWFDLADAALQRFARGRRDASPVRCWPHHFDIATRVTLEGAGEEARSVGLGLSPGDGGVPQPYFYVTPWPYPPADALPELPLGSWNTKGWIGAVLDGESVLSLDDREAGVDRFLRAAFAACADVVR